MWIDRSVTSRLVSVSRQFPSVLLTGARQTGKTSLLRHVYPEASFVSFDLPSIADQAETQPLEFLKSFREPVILDEVQYVPALFRYLKALIDQKRHSMGRFLMSGSQKFPLMKSLSESLAGRCAVLELDTLSADEVHWAFPKKPPSLIPFLWRGGFPELHRSRILDPREFFHSYLVSYLERDIRSLLQVGNLRDFERFLRGCALRSGQLLNLSDLARDVGIAGTTARDWISVLEASNQILLLEPYFSSRGKRMIKAPKMYLRDTGLLCYLLGLDSPVALKRTPFAGAIWETFILNEIRKQATASGSPPGLFFWRDAYGLEVDFVLEHKGRVKLIEAKWAEEVSAPKQSASIRKVLAVLGKQAAEEHWIVCRTKHNHRLRSDSRIQVVNGYTASYGI